MNINKLAKMTLTSKETIRVYREKGLLHPQKNKNNNYFVYTMREFCTILFIKKMRYFNMSLANIKDLLNKSNQHIFIEKYNQQIEALEEEKKHINSQIKHLKMAKEYLESSLESEGGVIEQFFSSTRYDIYPELLKKEDKGIFEDMLKRSDIYINTVYISKESILDDSKGQLSIYFGLGINDAVVEQYKVKVPSQAIIFPSGIYLVTMIKVTQFEGISQEVIKPIINYAKENNYKLLSGVTSFLAYIDHTSNSYFYRIRVLVEKM